MPRRLSLPGATHYGPGALDALEGVPGSRALVVADPHMRALGILDVVTPRLRAAGKEVAIFEGVVADPTRSSCEAAAAFAREARPDLIVALGGGSAIDTAKVAWALYEHPELTWERLTTFFALPPLRQKARLVAIPTTSGTGSEVSFAAMVTNERADPPIKECVLAHTLSPDVTIADPALTLTVPPPITAWTGFDVLSHAIEAAVSRFATDVTAALSAKALQLVVRWLPVAYADSGDLEARDHLQQASLIAGMAMASAALGVMHSLAHALGAVFHLHHGLACAYAMSQSVGFNRAVAADGYAELARTGLGVAFATPDEGCDGLVDAIEQLKARVGIAPSLRAAGITAGAFEASRRRLVSLASADTNRPSNPREYTDADLDSLVHRLWAGAPSPSTGSRRLS